MELSRSLTALIVCLTLLLSTMGCVTESSFWRNQLGSTDSGAEVPYKSTTVGRMSEVQRLADRLAEADSRNEAAATAGQLLNILKQEDESLIRTEVVRVLAATPTDASLDAMQIALQDKSPEIRVLACEGLAKSNSLESISILSDTLARDADLDVRIAAARALGQFQSATAVEALTRAINDPDPALQFVAVQSLRQSHSEDLGNNINSWRQLARTLQQSDQQYTASNQSDSNF